MDPVLDEIAGRVAKLERLATVLRALAWLDQYGEDVDVRPQAFSLPNNAAGSEDARDELMSQLRSGLTATKGATYSRLEAERDALAAEVGVDLV